MSIKKLILKRATWQKNFQASTLFLGMSAFQNHVNDPKQSRDLMQCTLFLRKSSTQQVLGHFSFCSKKSVFGRQPIEKSSITEKIRINICYDRLKSTLINSSYVKKKGLTHRKSR